MNPQFKCDGGDDGGLRCQFALLELSKPSNFGGNINNWDQSVRTQNGTFHFNRLMGKAVIQHSAMTQTMVGSGVSLSLRALSKI
jgi:hypothetical protein